MPSLFCDMILLVTQALPIPVPTQLFTWYRGDTRKDPALSCNQPSGQRPRHPKALPQSSGFTLVIGPVSKQLIYATPSSYLFRQ